MTTFETSGKLKEFYFDHDLLGKQRLVIKLEKPEVIVAVSFDKMSLEELIQEIKKELKRWNAGVYEG